MRFGFGLAVLGLSVVGLGWLGQARYAPFIQDVLSDRAAAVVAGSRHGVTTRVEGRDIHISGLADTAEEREALVAALDAVRGRRVVVDALTVLPRAEPYSLNAIWVDQALETTGHAPSEAALASLNGLGAEGLTLASGAPDERWGDAAGQGLAALRQLEEGALAIVDRRLSVVGIARTPDEGAAVRRLLDGLPEGYQADLGLQYLDDGSPAAYTLHYSASAGAWLDGKLPVGVTGAALAEALGLPSIDNGASQALIGPEGTLPEVVARLRPWLPELEALDIAVSPDGTEVTVGFGAGADLELLAAELAAVLGDEIALSVSRVAASGAQGETRTNAATGRTEVLRGAYWLPEVAFEPTPDTCAAQTDAILAEYRIGFVTGSARLDARARSAVNALAAVLRPCLAATGLRAEIGGNTDSTGTPEGNMALSVARARAVREALIMRGLPVLRLTAAGYGATQPVGDNETEEGRQANRRTAVRWID
ncbi:MAG: hypothetical protein Kow0013_21310 [Pararhodobacter sp.]